MQRCLTNVCENAANARSGARLFAWWRFAVAAIAALCLFANAGTASAQVLIWSLPEEDGAWIDFTGTYRVIQARPNNSEGDLQLEWRSDLRISSVGKETADVGGKSVACRWVEFKSVTKPNDLEKSPGPGGICLYKVLIPEDRVTGKTVDEVGLPITYLPIVKGYRKVGERDVEEVNEKVLGVYPLIAPVVAYPDLKPASPPQEDLDLGEKLGPVSTNVFDGNSTVVSEYRRSTNAGRLWRAETLPFGLAKFRVNLLREERGVAAPPGEFSKSAVVEVELTAVEKGTGMKSELGDAK
jgi:hypothetical protein